MNSTSLWPLVTYFAVVGASVVAVLAISALVGQKTPMRRATGEPYESGVVSVGTSTAPVSVEFYLVAMFFVIFDLEAVYIFAWAIAFPQLGWFGYLEMCIFVLVLLVGLGYAWRSGALDWGARPGRQIPASGRQ